MMNTINTETHLNTLGKVNNDYPSYTSGKSNIGQDGLIIQVTKDKSAQGSMQLLASPNASNNGINNVSLNEKLQDSSNTTGASNILKLIHEMYLEMRKEAAETKHGEYQLKWTAMDAAADKMEVAAHKELAASIVTGAISMAGGMFSMYSGARAVSSTKQANGIQNQMDASPQVSPARMQALKADHQALTAKATSQSTNGFAAMQVGTGVGQMVAAPITHSAALDRADKERLDAEATKAQAHIDAEADFVRSLTEGTKSIRDFIEQLAAAREKVHSKIVS